MSLLPPIFPSLPSEISWPPAVVSGHNVISDIYLHARRILSLADSDSLRVAFHIDSITTNAVSILAALEEQSISTPELTPIPANWLHDSALLLADLVNTLSELAELGKGKEDARVYIPELVAIENDVLHRPGRPKKSINLDFLCEAMASHRHLKLQELADVLGIHRNTLRAHLKTHNLQRQYDQISDSDLDRLINTFKVRKPESGLGYVTGFLRNHGLRVQRRRVVGSLRRIDGVGRALRSRIITRRKIYHVKRPNALWHLDGHHKMNRWGIVLHGFIDGYSRTVTGLRASTNNRALTVLDLFLDSVEEYGMPSRLRGDRGGENMACAIYMVMRNGPNRASFMWGSSTRNTRIERLWVEVGSQFVRRWRAFFSRLERLHQLDIDNPAHLWLLHSLFLDDINNDCKEFLTTWNNHPLSRSGTGHHSPSDLRLLGQARHGLYVDSDDCLGLDEDTIDRFYGVDRYKDKARHRRTGAGHPPDEIGAREHEDIAERIAQNQAPNVRHEGAPVTQGLCPFSTPEDSNNFFVLLASVLEANIIPTGYGIRTEEWPDGIYPVVEYVSAGQRGSKEVAVSLSDSIWVDRARLWVQALALLTAVTMTDDI